MWALTKALTNACNMGSKQGTVIKWVVQKILL